MFDLIMKHRDKALREVDAKKSGGALATDFSTCVQGSAAFELVCG